VCDTICGDKIKIGQEECDNGNQLGCSEDCLIDTGF
jgi:cysteine-rich repeat protein